MAFNALVHNFIFLRHAQLISSNAIFALGGISVGLREIPGISEAVLQIFQQRFSNPPSSSDVLIINQLAEMIIAGNVKIFSLKN